MSENEIAAWKRVEKERRKAMTQRRRRRGVEAVLAELVRLKDLKEANPAAYEREGPAKERAWLHARRILSAPSEETEG